ASRAKTYLHPTYGLHYHKENKQQRHQLDLRFSNNGGATNARSLRYKIIHPALTYTYQLKLNQWWLGAYFNSSSLLLFPQHDTDLFEDNPNSYTVTNGFGFALDRRTTIWQRPGQRLDLSLGIRSALITNIVRPPHTSAGYLPGGTPSPANEVSEPTPLNSGKWYSYGKHQSWRLQAGLRYELGQHLSANLNYALSWQRVGGVQPLSHFYQQIELGLGCRF
ncbi:MAG: hypothetical protein AAGJ82_15240, partial [Bacteroidota bacterium]